MVAVVAAAVALAVVEDSERTPAQVPSLAVATRLRLRRPITAVGSRCNAVGTALLCPRCVCVMWLRVENVDNWCGAISAGFPTGIFLPRTNGTHCMGQSFGSRPARRRSTTRHGTIMVASSASLPKRDEATAVRKQAYVVPASDGNPGRIGATATAAAAAAQRHDASGHGGTCPCTVTCDACVGCRVFCCHFHDSRLSSEP